jgi:UPF0755 protein
MKEKMPMIVKYILEIILLIFISFIYYLSQPVKTPKVLYIPKGSINQIITQLEKKNYDVCKLDALILRFIGSPQSGWINMGTKVNTRADFLYKLTRAKAAMRSITLIPGETTYVFLNQLAENLHLNREKLQKAFDKYAPLKEGVLVPNTYKIPLGISEEELIKLLLNTSMKKMKAISYKLFGTYNEKKWFRYVTIASIIQKESANNKEMPLVSSVVYNRLQRGMKLQMDGSLNYGKYSHQKVTHKRIVEDKSSYNTYLHTGIPNTPVCNVSQEALMAAIFPAKTKYLYFMRSKKGTHDFACNYSTHLRNIKRATK